MRKLLWALLPVSLMLAGCGDDPEEKAQEIAQSKMELMQKELELKQKELELKERSLSEVSAPAAPASPVVVNSGSDSGLSDVILGAAVGGLVANAMNTSSHSASHAPVIVHKTVVKKTVYKKPKPYKAYKPYKPKPYKLPQSSTFSKPKRY
ncbi:MULTISPECIES: hypothetical protein [Aeromonas]|uniref:hypothetical protein n=1 Tax=Aeromonas TaxID=642 RepID=UPI002B2D5C13|nr:hypothetical protein VAWG002_42400 [Aeromonas veronii]